MGRVLASIMNVDQDGGFTGSRFAEFCLTGDFELSLVGRPKAPRTFCGDRDIERHESLRKMPDVKMPEELDIDREDLSLSNEIVESDEDNREAIVCGDGRG
ncbi:hypothetical protein ACLKA6_014899 [Drosophila palustris]